MEKFFEQALLYDFYGELLTPHQRNMYEDAVYNDMSLGEIAQEYGISRQGVHDLIKRCDRILQEYEEKLHLVEKFAQAKERVGEILELTRFEDEEPAQEKQDSGEGFRISVSSAKRRLYKIRELSIELMKAL